MGGLSSTKTTNFEVYQSATVVGGNVGVGPYSVWTHGLDATITGRLDNDPTVPLPTITGTIGGGIHSPDMAPVVADASAPTLPRPGTPSPSSSPP